MYFCDSLYLLQLPNKSASVEVAVHLFVGMHKCNYRDLRFLSVPYVQAPLFNISHTLMSYRINALVNKEMWVLLIFLLCV